MYTTINSSSFHDAFIRMDRKDQFSYEAREALFSYLEEYEESTGQQIELDVIALCCDYAEYDNLKDFLSQTWYTTEDYETIEDLEQDTTVITIPNSEAFIVQSF